MSKTNFTSEDNRLTISRQFDAPLNLVWKAWTTLELLDQWWAPKPWKAETKRMDFKEGGHRLYAMVGPEGEKHWALMNYKSITVEKNFSGDDAFCDEEGNVNGQMPVSEFVNNFSENNGKTEVVMLVEYASKEHLEQIVKMGMKEGLSMAFEGLDELLSSLKQ